MKFIASNCRSLLNVGLFAVVFAITIGSSSQLVFSADHESSSCPQTSGNREHCYSCCVGVATAEARRIDLKNNKFDSEGFCRQRALAIIQGNSADFLSKQQNAVMSDSVAGKFCLTAEQTPGPLTPKPENPCIEDCRNYPYGTKK